MMTTPKTNHELLHENERLRLRLEEAEAVVEAIRNGIVDAVVVNSTPGESVYTLEGADRPYRLLVEAMQQGVAVLNPAGVLLYCNTCLADLFKMSVEKLTGCTLDSFAAEADHAMFTDMLGGAENASAQKEVLLRRQDGTTFPAAFTVSVLPLQKFCLLVTDLSQQQQYDDLVVSKAALLNSEIRYRRLFETAKDGVLILNMETGRITDANPFMSELLGYTHAHFLDKELWEIGLFSDKAANETAVRELQQDGYIRYEHLPLETTGGLRVEVEVVANAYREGDISVIQCNIRDITERSRLEKLMQGQAIALADLDRRKDEFPESHAGSRAARNPLCAHHQRHTTPARLQKNKDQLQQQAYSIIERQVGQLTRLVDDLLEVSRITTGKIHLQQEWIALNGIVERALETTRPLMDQRGHDLTVSLSPQTILLYADAARLEQVIVNLVANAAKYTADGGHISLAVQQEGNEAVLRVRDTGVGIAPELLPRIFDLFTQAERSLDRSQGGLGIGLCLVQRLVEMHGGRVEVYSALGQGSEFVVRLPVMVTPATQPPSTSKDSAEPTGPSLRVLVVDDNVDAAQSLALLLEESGHEVQTAYDGPTALKIALDYRPNVVLLDIGLPGFDGFEVAKRLRQQPHLRNVVLVAMTGYGQAADKQRSQEAGFNHHLVKPANFGKVLQILATVQQKAI